MTSPTAHPANRHGATHSGTTSPARALIVGCGRSLWSDDQAGLRVADHLAAQPLAGARVSRTEAPGGDILTELDGQQLLIVIDAARGTALGPPGRLTLIQLRARGRPADDPRRVAWIAESKASAHALGVMDALNVAESIGTLPPEVWVAAIRGRRFDFGEALSPEVASGLGAACEQLRQWLAAWLARPAGAESGDA